VKILDLPGSTIDTNSGSVFNAIQQVKAIKEKEKEKMRQKKHNV